MKSQSPFVVTLPSEGLRKPITVTNKGAEPVVVVGSGSMDGDFSPIKPGEVRTYTAKPPADEHE